MFLTTALLFAFVWVSPQPYSEAEGPLSLFRGEGAVGDGSGRKQTSVRARLAGSACPAKPSCSSFKTETTSSGEWDSPSRAEANPQMLGSMASNSRLKQTMRIINSLTNKRTKVPVLLRDPRDPERLTGGGGRGGLWQSVCPMGSVTGAGGDGEHCLLRVLWQ